MLTKPLQKENFASRDNKKEVIIPIPDAEGKLQKFKVWPSNTLHPDLAKKFPNIQTYEGIGLDDPTTIIRFETTSKGFTAMIWSVQKGTQVIQPLTVENQLNRHIVYYKKWASRSHQNHFSCQTDHINQIKAIEKNKGNARFNDGQLRTYRLA